MKEYFFFFLLIWFLCRRRILWGWIEAFVQSFTFDVDGFFEDVKKLYKKKH